MQGAPVTVLRHGTNVPRQQQPPALVTALLPFVARVNDHAPALITFFHINVIVPLSDIRFLRASKVGAKSKKEIERGGGEKNREIRVRVKQRHEPPRTNTNTGWPPYTYTIRF